MIRYFVLPLFLLVLIAAVLFGCWWLIPVVLVLLAITALGFYSWRWASRMNPAGMRAWFVQNRSRLAWAASIFTSILLVLILIACLWHRYAPDCSGGCLGGAASAASPDLSHDAAIAPVAAAAPAPLIPIRSMDVAVTKEFTNDISIPPGQMVLWESVEGIPFEILTPSGSTYPQPRRPANDTRTPCERMVWINEATSSFKVRIAPDAPESNMTFRIVYYPYQKGGPCS